MDVMEEGIRPELNIQSSTDKEGTDVLIYCIMSAFDRTILIRRICTSRMNFIVMIGKYVENIRISPKLTPLVKEYVHVFTNRTIDEH